MKDFFIFISVFLSIVGCAKKDQSSGIYSHLIAENLLYRFSLQSISFDKIGSYLEKNQEEIENIYLRILIPTPKGHLTEMVSIYLKSIKLSEEQKKEFIAGIRGYLQEKTEVESPHLKYDLLLQIELKNQSGVEIKMETKAHEDWNTITYAVYDDSNKSLHSVRKYRILDSIGLQKFLAEFTLSLNGNENSRGVERLREIWPDLKVNPTFLKQDIGP